jgi:hypothetical protein
MKNPARSHPARATVLLAILAGVAMLAAPASAQWQWRDGNKQLHVSDVPPPPDIPDKDILKRPVVNPAPAPARVATAPASAPTAASAPGNNKLEAEAEARKAKADQEAKAKQKAAEEANATARAENCTQAKRQLATVDSGVRIARTNANGEREILDDKGRAEEAERARKVIASDCK